MAQPPFTHPGTTSLHPPWHNLRKEQADTTNMAQERRALQNCFRSGHLESSARVEGFVAVFAGEAFAHVLLLVTLQRDPVRVLLPTEVARVLKNKVNEVNP